MQKQISSPKKQKCLCGSEPPAKSGLNVTKKAFNRYVNQKYFLQTPHEGINVYKIPCGCFLWVNEFFQWRMLTQWSY